jgi:uncharacterized protein YeaO (DUF488 family)
MDQGENMRTVRLYTAQIGKYQGTDGIDITVWTKNKAGQVMSPSEAIVFGHKHFAGDKRYTDYPKVNDTEYRTTYRLILIERYEENKARFLAMLQTEELTLLCYCRQGKFCHRHQAADILKKIGIAHGIEVILMGER